MAFTTFHGRWGTHGTPSILALVGGLALASAAGAVHLFPLFLGDPGGDCAQKLDSGPGRLAGQVSCSTFDDRTSGSSTTTIKVGQSVTWKRKVPYATQ